jgi:hypothetical protein
MAEQNKPNPYEVEVSRTTRLNFELDDERIEAIKACLDKGRLSINITDVDLTSGGRFENGYQYD